MVAVVEFDTGFIPYFLNRMDSTYTDYPERARLAGHADLKQSRFKNAMIPSDFWCRNIRVAFQEDPLGLQRLRDLIGPETMM